VRGSIVVVCFTGDSGLTDYSLSLARELNKTIQTVVVTGISLPKNFDALGVPVRRFFRRSRWYPLDVLRFFFAVVAERPRALLFQAQLKVPVVEGLMVTVFRWLGIRCVLTVHDVLPHYPRSWSAAEFTWFYRRFDRLVVHSEAARSALQRMGVRRPMLVVPHGAYDLFRIASPDKAAARRRLVG